MSHGRTFLALCVLLLSFAGVLAAKPDTTPAAAGEEDWLAPPGSAEQRAYWWQDEIRQVAFALSRARTGKVAQWPRMHVSPGSATLPVPLAVGQVTLDGKLDEPAWRSATVFPAGPIFGPWESGPFTLTVRALRQGRNVLLGIESRGDLSGLSALTDPQALFRAGAISVRVGGEGKIPGGIAKQNRSTWVLELAVPMGKGSLAMTFFPEAVRRVGGKLPAGLAALGVGQPTRGRRGPNAATLWLTSQTVRLTPASDAVQILPEPAFHEDSRTLTCRLLPASGKPKETRVALKSAGGSGVFLYQWQPSGAGGRYAATGFLYTEPVGRKTRALVASIGTPTPNSAASSRVRKAALLHLQSRLLQMERERLYIRDVGCVPGKRIPISREAWRNLYCRTRHLRAQVQLARLDAPLLFVKRHPYMAGHIYDDYYPWRPGGGIYVIDNPAAPWAERKVVPVIDPTTKPTLGEGVYRDPDVHWDAGRVLFAHKAAAGGHTSIYEIGLASRTLRRLTDAEKDIAEGRLCASASRHAGHHDITPAYLGDDRIVFTSTRPRGLVPCFNSTVDTLHVMNADGQGLRSISVNNVNEFDPAPLPDGRVLYGRWEYVDKTALYMQSLWTVNPDGTNERSIFANNLSKPTAVLDARPVGGTRLIAASLTPHNGQAVGAIAMIDPECDKNDIEAVVNFTPEYPIRMDQGLRTGPCDPWPLDKDCVLISNNAIGAHGILELVDRQGRRELVHCDQAISCYAPMLIKPRPRPAVLPDQPAARANGRFLIKDIYQGLPGVARGSITHVRVVEETSRRSGLPPGGRWWNQAFLVSWQGGYTIKNFLGVVPVQPDGSAYFEAPPGKALYFQALDADGRMVQSMRTFIQAAPGVTRSCIGCHEYKQGAPARDSALLALQKPPVAIQGERWGSGYLDYASMVQPVLDKHCVRCHGGEKNIAGGVDLTGGWTWAFNISYETFIKNTLVGYLNCHNGSVHTSQILPPRAIGSGQAPLAKLLLGGHKDRLGKLTRAERDLLFAWMDGNSCYYGTWNYTPRATCQAVLKAGSQLAGAMRQAGCTKCHAPRVGNDWINLRTPARSRILRAPLAKGAPGGGLGWCRNRKAPAGLGLVTQRNQPPDVHRPSPLRKPDPAGQPHVTFASTEDPHYRRMLAIIRRGRDEALARPRVDMPGARIIPGECRQLLPPPLPEAPLAVSADASTYGEVTLRWPSESRLIGLVFEIHAGDAPAFAPTDDTRIAATTWFAYTDATPPAGLRHYAVVPVSDGQRGHAAYVSVKVSAPPPPPAPRDLQATPMPGAVALQWRAPGPKALRYHVYRAEAGGNPTRLTDQPIDRLAYTDAPPQAKRPYAYAVRAVDRRGAEGPACARVSAAAMPVIREPMLTLSFPRQKAPVAALYQAKGLTGRLHGGAKAAGAVLDLSAGGHATLPKHPHMDLGRALTVECWVRLDKPSPMPVVLACGAYMKTGWFLQRYQNAWRWHVGGVSCDGGRRVVGTWHHLVCVYTGQRAELYQDGRRVASVACAADTTPWSGPMVIGQYANPAESYQMLGRVGGVKLYRRVLTAEEAAAHYKGGPPK